MNLYSRNSESISIKSLFLTKDGLFALLMCLSFARPLLKFVTRPLVGHNPTLSFLMPYIDALVLIPLVIIVFQQLIKKIELRDIIYYLLCVCIVLVQYFIFPSNSDILDDFSGLFLLCVLPVYFLGLQIDLDKQDNYFRWTSIIAITLLTFYGFVYSPNVHGIMDEADEDMGLAYAVCPFTVFMVWQALKQTRTWIDVIYAIGGTLVLIALGTRGTIVCVFVFIVFYVIFLTKGKYKLIAGTALSVLGGFAYFYFDRILELFLSILPKIGMSTRIMTSMAEGAFISYENSSGRDVILSQLWDALQNNDYNALGLCGSWAISGGYAHNIYFDFIVSFGLIGGTIGFILLLLILLWGFLSCKTDSEKGFYFVLFSIGFFKLFMSDFFLAELALYWLIGYCVSRIRMNYSFKI